MQQSGPFAAGAIDRPSSRREPVQAIQAPRPFWDSVQRRTDAPSQPERVAQRETVLQSALNDRHRQVEALVGRPVPRSVMLSGLAADEGAGLLDDREYESRLEAMRQEFPQLAGIESRDDLNARLSGRPTVAFYETARGPAEAKTLSDGSLWLETSDGFTGPLSRFPGARPIRRSNEAPAVPANPTFARARTRGLGERFTSAVEDAARTNPMMALSRLAVGGGYDEFEDPETGQTLRFATFGQQARDQERERRDAYRLMAQGDSWDGGDTSFLHKLARGAVTLAGTFAGAAADPTSLIAPGSTVVGRIAGGVAINTAGDAVTQVADIGSGIQREYEPLQTVAAGVTGGVLQGGLEGLGAIARRFDSNPGGVVEALAREIDVSSRTMVDPASRAALSRIDRDLLDATRIGPVDGATHDSTLRSLDELKNPVQPNPLVERDIDDLTADMTPPDSAVAPVPQEGSGQVPPEARPSIEAGTGQSETLDYQGRPIIAGTFDPMRVEADPARFQYKASGDEGLTDRLAGVTSWDRTAAGRSILFEDRDGTVVVADGHQRRGLARRLIETGQDTSAMLDGFLFRQADGWEPADVRVVAALKNIREGSGSILDAAKVFREAPERINDRSLPLTGDFIQNARGLARLSDDAFGAVANGIIPDRYGAVIGDMASDRADLHASIVDLMRQGEPRSIDEARAMVQEAKLADFAETSGLQGDMFGGVPAQSTLIARARLRVAVMKQLRGDARLFSSLIRNADAIEAGGNALARTENEARLARDLAASAAVDRLSLRVGQVGDSFGAAALAITRGDMTTAAGARAIIDELRQASSLADAVDDARAIALTPERPSEMAVSALAPFDLPGGRGQLQQIEPKPEDVASEARLATLWDDLPEAGEEQRALDVLRVCAPGRS